MPVCTVWPAIPTNSVKKREFLGTVHFNMLFQYFGEHRVGPV
eukprot:SAG31_NODE_23333_length_506_cov_1.105651_1_plen_41_part_10